MKSKLRLFLFLVCAAALSGARASFAFVFVGPQSSAAVRRNSTRSRHRRRDVLLGVRGGDLSAGMSSFSIDAACVGAGAVAGALCRYQVGNVVTRAIAEGHPRLSRFKGWHTAAINVVGSFLLGALAGMPASDSAATSKRGGIHPRTRLMTGVGFCGSFTTFSTFAVDVVGMLCKGEVVRAFSYVVLNNAGGILAAFAGFNLTKQI